MNPGRLACLAAVVAIAACGLLWRSPGLGLPPMLAKYGGSALWGAMIYFGIGFILGRRPPVLVALCAAGVSAAVEASQAISYAPLDAARATAAGALLLGRTFSWWDIAAYWVGIVLVRLAIGAARRTAR